MLDGPEFIDSDVPDGLEDGFCGMWVRVVAEPTNKLESL
jgi:hypothetical protein